MLEKIGNDFKGVLVALAIGSASLLPLMKFFNDSFEISKDEFNRCVNCGSLSEGWYYIRPSDIYFLKMNGLRYRYVLKESGERENVF